MGLRIAPPGTQLGQCELRGELPAAIPDGLTTLRGVRWQDDGMTGDLARVVSAMAPPDPHTGLGEAGEELLLGARPGCGGAHLSPSAPPAPRRTCLYHWRARMRHRRLPCWNRRYERATVQATASGQSPAN